MDPFFTPEMLERLISGLGLSPRSLQDMMTNPNILRECLDRATVQNSQASITREISMVDFAKNSINVKEQLERDQNLPPMKATPIRRFDLLQGLSESRISNMEIETGGQPWVRNTYIGMPQSCSHMPLSKLKRVTISKMLIRKTHKGRFLLCRVITMPTRLISVLVGVEDPEGSVGQLAIYNFPGMTEASHADLDTLLPKGTILAIKEPTYKMASHGNMSLIRVDAPSDLIFLGSDSIYLRGITWSSGQTLTQTPTLPRSIDEWLSRGRKEFGLLRILTAAICFSKGLELDPGHQALILNRAQCYLRLHWHNAALADAELVRRTDALDPSLSMKAMYRSARARYMLGQYSQVIELLQNQSQTDCFQLLENARQRIHEQSTGEYDWGHLYKVSQVPCPQLDVADYCGPVEVGVNEIAGGGRGVFITADVEIGELLMVSKPLASCLEEDLKDKGFLMAFDFRTKEVKTRTQVSLIHRIIHRLWDDAILKRTLESLYAGPSFDPPCQYQLTRVESESEHPSLQNPLQSVVDTDAAHVEAVCSFNSFGLTPITLYTDPVRPGAEHIDSGETKHTLTGGTALYSLPSLCNHACLPSAYWFILGDAIVIRAARAMKRGEEVTVPYVDIMASFNERATKLTKWGFNCNCDLCKDEEAIGEETRNIRDAVKAEGGEDGLLEQNASTNANAAIRRAKLRLKKVQATYCMSNTSAPASVFKPALMLAHYRLSHVYIIKACTSGDKSYFRLSIEEKMKSIEMTGIIILDKSMSGRLGKNLKGVKRNEKYMPIDTKNSQCHAHEYVILTVLQLSSVFNEQNDHARGKAWLNAAIWIHRMLIGGDENLFKLRYTKCIQNLHLENLF